MSAKRRTAHQVEELDLGLPPGAPPPELTWPTETDDLHLLLPPSGLSGTSTGLFVQAYTDEPTDVAQLVGHAGVGAVFTIRRNRKQTRVQQGVGAVRVVRRRTPTASLLVDANAYSGKKRKYASDGLSPQWVRHQHHDMQLTWAITDSGFARDIGEVQTLLTAAARIPGNLVTALPIPWKLLRDRSDRLADLINDQPHPVAFMLEHPRDPFDEAGVAGAFVDVIQHAAHPVLLLRSDTSALGALSYGAAVGAVGSAGLRHIYPSTKKGGAAKLAFVIPELLTYTLQTKFEQAYLRNPALSAWRCPCWFCAGRDLTWIANPTRYDNPPETFLHRAAFQHSVAALAMLGANLLTPEHTNMASAWSALCGDARRRHENIAAGAGPTWVPKAALRNWQELLPVTASR